MKMSGWVVVVVLLVSGCAHQNSGIRYYEPVQKVDRNGNTYTKNEIVASIATDMPGVESVEVGKLAIKFSGEAMQTEEAVYDRKGNFVTKLTQRYLPGIYPSHTIKAQGEATARVTDAAAAGVTGAVLSGGGAAVAGGVPGALGAAFGN
jgi:hypothetical protein